MIYEYECLVCGEAREVSRPAERRDDALVCSEGHAMHRKLSRRVGLVFLGRGWAKDGYAKA